MESRVEFKHKTLKVKCNQNYVKITLIGYFINPYGAQIKDKKIYIDETTFKEYEAKEFPEELSIPQMLKKNLIYTYKFDMRDILKDNSQINGITRVTATVDDKPMEFRIRLKGFKKKNPRYYYIPFKSLYNDRYAIHLRRTFGGSLVFVKRLKEKIEDTSRFKFLESKPISALLYTLGKFWSKIRVKNVNIFYEKFSEKAEEGVYDLCKMCNENEKSNNYFVIDETSSDYEKIKDDKNVLKKYSFKYYWKLYSANYYIGSEAPTHLNILRSNNKYIRKAMIDKPFIFLQHGIIYMKNLGINSYFNKGREAQSEYMIVSSEKERNVVSEMLGYDKSRLLKTGLRNF